MPHVSQVPHNNATPWTSVCASVMSTVRRYSVRVASFSSWKMRGCMRFILSSFYEHWPTVALAEFFEPGYAKGGQ